jgi:hypothetical protein
MLTFITIGASETEEIIGYTKDLLSDLTPILLIITGIAVGLLIFWAIMSAIKKH